MNYLITGGSRGIGAELVRRAAELGHNVAFTYLSEEAAAQSVAEQADATQDGTRIRFDRLDVRDGAQVEQVVDAVLDDFGTVDVLVNNAGITRDNLLVSMEDEEWSDVLAVNLTGPFLMSRQVLPSMMRQRFGRVINLSSLAATGGSGQGNYSASKAGLHGLTQTIAKEYGRKGITANAVVPGFFDTDMTRTAMPEHIRNFWQVHCPVPEGRIGEVEELSAVVLFLASKEAAYVNGQIIRVTGGLDWGP